MLRNGGRFLHDFRFGLKTDRRLRPLHRGMIRLGQVHPDPMGTRVYSLKPTRAFQPQTSNLRLAVQLKMDVINSKSCDIPSRAINHLYRLSGNHEPLGRARNRYRRTDRLWGQNNGNGPIPCSHRERNVGRVVQLDQRDSDRNFSFPGPRGYGEGRPKDLSIKDLRRLTKGERQKSHPPGPGGNGLKIPRWRGQHRPHLTRRIRQDRTVVFQDHPHRNGGSSLGVEENRQGNRFPRFSFGRSNG